MSGYSSAGNGSRSLRKQRSCTVSVKPTARCAAALVRLSRSAVQSKFRALLAACPVFRRRNQRAPDALPPAVWFDVPAFEISNPIGQALLRIRANRQFRETDWPDPGRRLPAAPPAASSACRRRIRRSLGHASHRLRAREPDACGARPPYRLASPDEPRSSRPRISGGEAGGSTQFELEVALDVWPFVRQHAVDDRVARAAVAARPVVPDHSVPLGAEPFNRPL